MLVVWTMLADLSTDDNRAALFFRVGLASQIASFLASAISSPLMALNPWIPLFLGSGVALAGLGCVFSLPETMNKVKSPEAEQMYSDDDEPPGPSESAYNLVSRKIERLIQPYSFLFTRPLLMLLLSFFTVQFARNALSFLTLYASTRFGWSIAQAHLLSSLYLAVTIPLFLFILPLVSSKLLHSLSASRRDLQIARLSIIAYIMGSLALGLSSSASLVIPSVCVYAFGAGFPIVIRSLIPNLVKRDETAKLYSVFEIVQAAGDILGGLCFTKAFSSSFSLGKEESGLVWLLSSLLYGLVELVLMLVHV
ncbi:MFS transporter [Penicillium angulare]|uniref:MFS transporter n=1 Tax=Penicillium angulare TaxID=116970 RepID=UPI00254216EC|nr:MFS transporter [Penicillium angulare]KAJ5266886.1 MFS transporter [Penicillium angulare]